MLAEESHSRSGEGTGFPRALPEDGALETMLLCSQGAGVLLLDGSGSCDIDPYRGLQ